MKKQTTKTPVKKKSQTSVRPRRGRKLLRRTRFLPSLVIAGFAAFLLFQPMLQGFASGDVLSYATSVSTSGLLTSTNSQRAAHGASNLSINSKLNAAAQAKAEDMVTRNYWSHVTPDGKQPWIFVTNAGYQYISAGENLAYGFTSSETTVIGWMNSPSHKTNLLSTNYTEVGFGIANSPSYVGNGEQTIVVAMYAKPITASAPVATKPKSTPAATKPAAVETPPPAPAPVETAPAHEAEIINTSVVEETEPVVATPATVQRVQTLGGGTAGWSVPVVLVALVGSMVLWMIHKGVHLRRYIVASEKFILHHIHLDLTVIAVIFLAAVLLSTSGSIR